MKLELASINLTAESVALSVIGGYASFHVRRRRGIARCAALLMILALTLLRNWTMASGLLMPISMIL